MGVDGQAHGFVFAAPQHVAECYPEPFPGEHAFTPSMGSSAEPSNPIDERIAIDPDFRCAFVRQLITEYAGDGMSDEYQIITETMASGERFTEGLHAACARQAAGTFFTHDNIRFAADGSKERKSSIDPDLFLEETF